MNMKKRIISISAILAMMLAASCTFEYPLPEIISNPALKENGYHKYTTVSIYEESLVPVKIGRTHGLSQELNVQLHVNEALLSEYNTVYSTDYDLMPQTYYEFPSAARIPEDSLDVTVQVKIFTDKLVQAVGIAKASNMIIPLRVTSSGQPIEEEANLLSALIGINVVKPIIDVQPEEYQLDFIPISPLTQDIEIVSTANFTTLAADKVTFSADEAGVAAYNAEYGTDYPLLPADRYKVHVSRFDQQSLQLQTSITFDCATMGGEGTFLLPLVMTQTEGYVVNQAKPVYVLINLTELRIWAKDAGKLLEPTTGKGTLELLINTPLSDDLSINLVYSKEKVSEYNAANGTSYAPLDPSLLTITSSVINASKLSGGIAYTVNVSKMEYDSGPEYLVPLVIDPSVLPDGTKIDAGVVWVKIIRTRVGTYTVTENPKGEFEAGPHKGKHAYNNTWRKMAKTINLASVVHGRFNPHGKKYSVNYSDRWSDGLLFFDVSDMPMADYPTRYPLINLQDRSNDGHESWGYSEDEVTYNSSYFDASNESFYFDFVIDNGSTAYEMGFTFTR